MKILVGGWFALPRMERDAFSGLMKFGVDYDKKMGFRLSGKTDIESAARLISSVAGEEVELSVRCFVCGREACGGCPYLGSCDRRRVSPLCLCAEHASSVGAYETYMSTFRENLGSS